ncbi:hypothetical protein ACFLWO_03285 [Chloroflexota bacterium]
MELKCAEGGRHFQTSLLPMVTGPLIGLAYTILVPLIGVVMAILLGTYKLGRVLTSMTRWQWLVRTHKNLDT